MWNTPEETHPTGVVITLDASGHLAHEIVGAAEEKDLLVVVEAARPHFERASFTRPRMGVAIFLPHDPGDPLSLRMRLDLGVRHPHCPHETLSALIAGLEALDRSMNLRGRVADLRVIVLGGIEGVEIADSCAKAISERLDFPFAVVALSSDP